MDTFTHLLLGHAMGVAASTLGTAPPNAVYWAVVVGNSLPDVDVPLSFLLRGDFKWHRTVTHTVAGAAGVSLVAALVLARAMPGAHPGWIFFWTLVGAWSHVATDVLNLFGVKLSTLARKSTAAGILHLTDPVLLGLLVTGSLLRAAPLGLALCGGYILWRAVRAGQIRRTLRQGGALRADLIPWYAGWRYVTEYRDRIEYGTWQVQGPVALATYPRPDTALLEQLGRHSQVKTFLASARYPYAIIGSDEVVWGCALRQIRADYRPLRLKLPCAES